MCYYTIATVLFIWNVSDEQFLDESSLDESSGDESSGINSPKIEY
jgi:nitrogen fixation-related uncharacterized protein